MIFISVDRSRKPSGAFLSTAAACDPLAVRQRQRPPSRHAHGFPFMLPFFLPSNLLLLSVQPSLIWTRLAVHVAFLFVFCTPGDPRTQAALGLCSPLFLFLLHFAPLFVSSSVFICRQPFITTAQFAIDSTFQFISTSKFCDRSCT